MTNISAKMRAAIVECAKEVGSARALSGAIQRYCFRPKNDMLLSELARLGAAAAVACAIKIEGDGGDELLELGMIDAMGCRVSLGDCTVPMLVQMDCEREGANFIEFLHVLEHFLRAYPPGSKVRDVMSNKQLQNWWSRVAT
jgi:hypothetical protein